ncbi:conjugal transfer protein TraH [Aliarcobacter butzleri]|uniref:conjugal transfer protein TraH n=1 Tax=Aliarcobacter butzleri TaxID=28197 RepID=UPI00344B0448
MKNRITISFILCGIMASNIQASLWDNSSIFNNVTDTHISTDPISGGTYLSGGAIEVRFKTSGNYPPIFAFGAPSLKASCRGITFDAGYAMFMNLERLGQQLSQAGTSLAYGVLIGLVYTMPGVEQAFTKLNEWSQWLQSFLNESCNIGTNFGKEIGTSLWKDVEGASNWVNNNIPSPSEYLDKPTDVNNLLSRIYKSGTETQQKQAEISIINKVFADSKGSAIASYINSLIKKGEENINFNKNELIEIQNLDNIGLTQSSQMMVYFISSIMSNVAVEQNAINQLAKNIKGKDEEKIAEMLEELGSEKTARTIQARNNITPRDFISFILNGTKNPSSMAIVGGLNMQGLKVALVSLNNKMGVKDEFIVLTDQTTGSATNAFNDFEGYIQESKNLVYKTYNEQLVKLRGVTGTSELNNIVPKVTSAYPMMYDIIRNLVLTTPKKELLNKDSYDSEITEILNYIAYKNAIALAGIAIENVNHAIKSAITEGSTIKKDSTITDANSNNMFNYENHIKTLNDQLKVLNEAITSLKIELKKVSDDVEKNDNVRKINDRLIEIIRERNLRGSSK